MLNLEYVLENETCKLPWDLRYKSNLSRTTRPNNNQ